MHSLAYFIKNGLSQDQYQQQINDSKIHNARYLTPYSELLKAKKQCYPPDVIVEVGLVQVPIWSVLNHQLPRLIDAENLFDRMMEFDPDDTEYHFDYKLGADACTANPFYQTGDRIDQQNSIFTSTMCPIYLKAVSKSNPDNYTILYAEQMAVSETRIIPLRMALEKETEGQNLNLNLSMCMNTVLFSS